MSDKTIRCVDCGTDFVFTDREQEWYREKGLAHEPRRCRNCRSTRKTGPGGGGEPAPRPAADGQAPAPARERPPRPPARPKEMHRVACATCGKETEIPFRPDPTRPVYCRECYVARGKKR